MSSKQEAQGTDAYAEEAAPNSHRWINALDSRSARALATLTTLAAGLGVIISIAVYLNEFLEAAARVNPDQVAAEVVSAERLPILSNAVASSGVVQELVSTSVRAELSRLEETYESAGVKLGGLRPRAVRIDYDDKCGRGEIEFDAMRGIDSEGNIVRHAELKVRGTIQTGESGLCELRLHQKNNGLSRNARTGESVPLAELGFPQTLVRVRQFGPPGSTCLVTIDYFSELDVLEL